DASLAIQGDFILCSHVLYYIDHGDWLATLVRMASWLTPSGVLAIVLQNHDTDCMRMLEAFHGRRFELTALAREFENKYGQSYQVERHLVPAEVRTPDFASAYTIAEFMLNLLPMPNPPKQHALEEYVRTHFAGPHDGFQFSCHQDCLLIRPRR